MTVATQFKDFDESNPDVYRMFKQFAFDLVAAGRKRMSGNMIVERVRWETSIQTTGDEFKVNAKFAAHLVRKLIEEHPRMRDMFSMRTIRVA